MEPETDDEVLPKKKARLSSDKNSHSILQFFTPSSSSRDDSQPVILDPSDELISGDSDSDTENGDVPRSAEEESTAEVGQPLIIDNDVLSDLIPECNPSLRDIKIRCYRLTQRKVSFLKY